MIPVVLYLLWIVLWGISLYALLNQERARDWCALVGTVLGLGMCSTGVILFWLSLAGFAPTRMLLSVLVVVATPGVYLFARLKAESATETASIDTQTKVLWALAACIVLVGFVFVSTHAMGFVNYETDAWMLWGLKARVVSVDPVRQTSYFYNLHYAPLHLNYPLLIPFNMASVNAMSGSVEEILPKAVFPIYFLTLVLFVAATARLYLCEKGRVCLVAGVACTPMLLRWAGSGYADVPLAALIAGNLYHLHRWMKSRRRLDLLAAAILGAGAAFTKNEGLAFAGITIVALAVFLIRKAGRKQVGRQLAMYVLILGLVLVPWLAFRSTLPALDEDYPSLLRLETITANVGRLGVVVGGILKHLLLNPLWTPLCILLLAAAIVRPWAIRQRVGQFCWIVLGLHLMTYVLIYVITPHDVEGLFKVTLDRLLIHLIPAASAAIAVHWSPVGGEIGNVDPMADKQRKAP